MNSCVRSCLALTAGCALAWIAGCSQSFQTGSWRSSGVEVHSVVPPSDLTGSVSGLLARVASLSPEEAREDLEAAWDTFADTGTDRDRLWVVLLAVRADEGPVADERAAALLERPPAQTAEGEDLGGLEALLYFVLDQRAARTGELLRAQAENEELRSELHSLDASLGSDRARLLELEAKLEEERRKTEALHARLEEERKRAAAASARLEAETKKAKALQGQIEQLKIIEKIIERRAEP